MRASKRSDGGANAAVEEAASAKGSAPLPKSTASQLARESPANGSVVSRRPVDSEPLHRGDQQLVKQRQVDDTDSAREAPATSGNRRVFGLNPRVNKVRHDEYAERRAKQTQSAPETSADLISSGECRNTQGQQAPRSSSNKIRASKYGNFYRPPDVVVAATSNSVTGLVGGATASEPKRVLVRQRSESPERRKVTTAAAVNGRAADGTATDNQVTAEGRTISDSEALGEWSKPRRTVRREDKYRKPSSMAAETTQLVNSTKPEPQARQQPSDNEQQAPKMQFSIPPPPKLNSGSMTKSSIISYAKSRIYDKQPTSQAGRTSQPTKFTGTSAAAAAVASCDVLTESIPESILSGFKPPKQVNVSKARERWEGGEPFAKCKSRQRLAQSADQKKCLYGSWSMTSVVATQRMQFQQMALSVANSPPATYTFGAAQYPTAGQPDDDTPVKILTRGSVLERVQQYERAPPSGGSNLRGSSTGSLSSSTGSLASGSSASSSSSFSSSVNDLQSCSPPSAIVGADEASVQIQPAASGAAAAAQSSKPAAIPAASPDQLISAALNRRFSLGGRRRSSASSAIPRFYHPNGKPNTYEIELQKKNIVVCFEKFTDRKALLAPAPAYKRHFHSIALACNFSEYFKEPLYRYIKHQMTNSNLLLCSPSGSPLAAGRKQSGSGPSMTNGLSITSPTGSSGSAGSRQAQTHRVALTRAASVDTSSVEKLHHQNYISCEQFLACWRHLISSCFDNAARFVHLLTLGQRNYLLPEDFVPLIQSVIDDHPGLKFLRSAPDFHMRYIQTVIARIYFCVNRSWTGKISLSELRRSNLLQVLEALSREEDINQITDYFSYEHFYVIYCKFWSLDQDHDLLISKEDLARHNEASISSRIIDRIFTGVVSKRVQETGKMSYSDFVWFLIAEEDKKHPRSIEYWFRLMDIDGDGYISMYEMEYFYYEQTKRLELMNIEALPFLDSACQILDLINPKEKNKISLSDLKRTKLATIFFDTFINLEKYLEHESREFVSSRDVIQNGQVVSDWDRYASEAYESLVTEESTV